MPDLLLRQIQKLAPEMSKSDKAIARYILDNYDKAAYMTAARLAGEVSVCESTVVRFAQKFGYDGYPQLRAAIQEMTKNNLTYQQRIEADDMRRGSRIMQSVLSNDIDMIRRTIDSASEEQFEYAVEALCAARRIYIIGTRSSSALANYISYYFSLVFEQVSNIDPSNESEIFEQIMHIGEGDVVIGISFPRYSRKAAKAMQFASDCGAKCIALTDRESSPIAQNADILLLAHTAMASIVDSLVAPMSIVNALIVAAVNRKKDELSGRFQRLEHILEEYDVYEKQML